jgi:hypothetical protein
VTDYLSIAPYGTLYYNVFAGKMFGTAPYQMLYMLPGNDWYYYSKYSFNLINRFQYLSDRYAGFSLEHNIGLRNISLYKAYPQIKTAPVLGGERDYRDLSDKITN